MSGGITSGTIITSKAQICPYLCWFFLSQLRFVKDFVLPLVV